MEPIWDDDTLLASRASVKGRTLYHRQQETPKNKEG